MNQAPTYWIPFRQEFKFDDATGFPNPSESEPDGRGHPQGLRYDPGGDDSVETTTSKYQEEYKSE